jgi:hypothetical protein
MLFSQIQNMRPRDSSDRLLARTKVCQLRFYLRLLKEADCHEGKLNMTGFNMKMLRFFDFAGMIVWFVRFQIFHIATFPQYRLLAFYDRYVVPVLGRVESYVRLPAGKNLICVAQRIS